MFKVFYQKYFVILYLFLVFINTTTIPFKLKKKCFYQIPLRSMSSSLKLKYFDPQLKVLEYLSLTSYIYLSVFASYFGNMLHTILSLKKCYYIPKLSSNVQGQGQTNTKLAQNMSFSDI